MEGAPEPNALNFLIRTEADEKDNTRSAAESDTFSLISPAGPFVCEFADFASAMGEEDEQTSPQGFHGGGMPCFAEEEPRTEGEPSSIQSLAMLPWRNTPTVALAIQRLSVARRKLQDLADAVPAGLDLLHDRLLAVEPPVPFTLQPLEVNSHSSPRRLSKQSSPSPLLSSSPLLLLEGEEQAHLLVGGVAEEGGEGDGNFGQGQRGGGEQRQMAQFSTRGGGE
eukprot:CAMPEP_0181291628 /NCGR_PEP_ID=MMETSP1101-20121128/2070_1 /TAXON_ID=46948 /ORGANISM="Rhodomonas abbreviata, Strain Caron Lab Isolate" /LENGTH=223 /DNA_ID=CAMNT_0023396035 /DNA_START=157 /DNA_END=825 /DNA_ORIENTATION=+